MYTTLTKLPAKIFLHIFFFNSKLLNKFGGTEKNEVFAAEQCAVPNLLAVWKPASVSD